MYLSKRVKIIFLLLIKKVENNLSNIQTTENDLLNVLKSLNVNKSPGPDGIHPKILRELCNELSYPLKVLFDKTMNEGKLPKGWKEAEVRPIFKNKGSKSSPGNYRPVSLTAVICKIFEKFVRDALCKHFTDNNLLSEEQYGFCKGRSCTTQLLVTLNNWMHSLDKKLPLDAAYLDFHTRTNSMKLGKPGFDTKKFQFFFTNRIINLWNKLPSNTLTSESLNTFKNNIDKNLKRYWYECDIDITKMSPMK